MQAFKVTLESSGAGVLYFCSLACAQRKHYPPQDGQFVLEKDFHRQERCANCETFLNDLTRSFTHDVVLKAGGWEKP